MEAEGAGVDGVIGCGWEWGCRAYVWIIDSSYGDRGRPRRVVRGPGRGVAGSHEKVGVK